MDKSAILAKEVGNTYALPEPQESFHEIIEKAKQFAWEHNSDSLRAFINYIK